MNIASVLVGLFVIGSSKAYGEATIGNEKFLSLAASLASMFGIFRFIWSFLLEKYSYVLVYSVLISI